MNGHIRYQLLYINCVSLCALYTLYSSCTVYFQFFVSIGLSERNWQSFALQRQIFSKTYPKEKKQINEQTESICNHQSFLWRVFINNCTYTMILICLLYNTVNMATDVRLPPIRKAFSYINEVAFHIQYVLLTYFISVMLRWHRISETESAVCWQCLFLQVQ